MSHCKNTHHIANYFEFMKKATTAVQTVDSVKSRLEESGFECLYIDKIWSLKSKGKYYVSINPTMVIAFTLGNAPYITKGFKIIAAHTDNPGFRIKPSPEVAASGMITLNVEKYGGPIFHTWFDRPLSIAGRVALKSEEVLKPVIMHIDFKRPLLTIPSLAIHMNKEVNSGVEIKVQKEMQPLLTQLIEEQIKDDCLLNLLAKELQVDAENILDTDLYVYCLEEGMLIGAMEEFISCPRIDDLSMVYAALEALISSEHEQGINMAAFLDNEEIGSTTKQGADSMTLSIVLEKIKSGMLRTSEQFLNQLMDSFIISADGAHALHPNYGEKNDITNKPIMNKGIAIKISGSRSYASEVETVSALQQLCTIAGVNVQKFVNHSDQAGGKTMGPLLSRYLPLPVVDMGVPMLAMHSTRELMGKQDFLDSITLFETFYSLK